VGATIQSATIQSKRRRSHSGRRAAALALLATLALGAAGCSTTTLPTITPAPEPQPVARAAPPAAQQAEHLRIITAYGGVYENARLQGLVERIVARLVAASERPDLTYQVTILNAPAVNAFALPNGQLY